MENTDLYNILELNNNATTIEIKKKFKELALKYHPDKNKSKNSNEKFNQIRIAYEILSNPEKKEKYDKMITSKKSNFTNMILMFIKEITNPKTIQNLMNRLDIIEDIKNGDINKITSKIIQKILNNIDLDLDMSNLTDIFIHSPSNSNQNQNTTIYESQNNNEVSEISSNKLNTLNIFGNVKTNLDDIYHNRLKEIIIKRKIYNNSNIEYTTNTYYIPLYDDEVIISEAGDQIINNNSVQTGSNLTSGNVILKIYYKKDKTNKIQRDDYNVIYNETISMVDLFYGFNKTIDYFGEIINISSSEPLKEYHFDGDKIIVILKNKGLPYDQNNNRGDLNIHLNLIKSDDFKDKLHKYFI